MQKPQAITTTFIKKQPLTKAENQNWHLKDIYTDSIPGISLEKAYDFLKNKKGDTIIVAVIDTELDIDHEDLKDQIWINKDEIPNNNIDDDNNGYIDDINGWNYVGSKKGDDALYTSYEYVRIIKKYDSLLKYYNLLSEVPKEHLENFKLYQKAYIKYDSEVDYKNSEIARYKRINTRYNKGKSVAKKYFPKEDYTVAKLDSLKSTINKKNEKKSISNLAYYVKYDIDEKWCNSYIEFEEFKLNTLFNFNYNDRRSRKDNTNDINDYPYGNNDVQGTQLINHATQIASIIAAQRNNKIGIDGINDLVKIMPLSIAAVGDDFDKDIALAIRYAVDNGAKIINMSLGKEFSMYPEWVNDAIKYAQDKNVLIITSAGNNGLNIDKNDDFPTDNLKGVETVQNFIKVGNTSKNINSKLIFSNSNYGKKNVDIYAPGTKINCLSRYGEITDTGTSLSSAVVSGVASLLFSYYPNLTAIEVKNIILESGSSYDLMVLKPYPNGEKRDPKKVPFSSLSKSGKIVNAYNALLMAEEVSKKKKKR
ncbi:S8 family serine peptidase [Kordia sp. SMS9]|uniref:S8 family serine peptidase n=1 Tax=Kordia sp. SMS9 TaxID=2282170 RepID=UPI00196322B4|nr:S8 family serine peptidase [Kordia sp. SMS9]